MNGPWAYGVACGLGVGFGVAATAIAVLVYRTMKVVLTQVAAAEARAERAEAVLARIATALATTPEALRAHDWEQWS